jgi:hypothetical protein
MGHVKLYAETIHLCRCDSLARCASSANISPFSQLLVTRDWKLDWKPEVFVSAPVSASAVALRRDEEGAMFQLWPHRTDN